jgi:prepilin-type N-terminal cleavage/methylation domain-containing protein
MKKNRRTDGFTLLEMLLVMVIAATIIVMTTTYMTQKADNMRIDKTVLEMQYVLNAGLAYYVANGQWPGSDSTWYQLNGVGSSAIPGGWNDTILQPNYLGSMPILDISGQGIWYIHRSTIVEPTVPENALQVWACVPGSTAVSTARANIIAGKLPMGYTVPGDSTCSTLYAAAYVVIPGQNLNNATAVNFAGLYHHGACVPVPTCPTTSSGAAMIPQVFVVPVSVSGINDPSNPSSVYPISSFTAYATPNTLPLNNTPPACSTDSTNTPACPSGQGNNMYWRACLQVVTERGSVQTGGATDWGKNVTVSAFTRCQIPNEPSGSDFTVYGN